MTIQFSTNQASKLCQLTVVIGFLLVLANPMAQADTATPAEAHLRSNPNLSLFTKAMDIAHYWERLRTIDSVTLLVPTDDAMASEGSDFLLKSVLMTNENRERLRDLVAAHIIEGLIEIEKLEIPVLLQTQSGDCLSFTQKGAALSVGGQAKILSIATVEDVRILTVNKLLIPDYQPSMECIAMRSNISKK